MQSSALKVGYMVINGIVHTSAGFFHCIKVIKGVMLYFSCTGTQSNALDPSTKKNKKRGDQKNWKTHVQKHIQKRYGSVCGADLSSRLLFYCITNQENVRARAHRMQSSTKEKPPTHT